MAQGRPALVQSPSGDLIVSQGADNTFGFVWSRNGDPVKLVEDGWVLEAQIRQKPGFEPWLTLSSIEETEHGSGIFVNDSGEILVHIDHRETEADAWNTRKTGVWDIEAFREDTDEKVRVVMGAVTVSHDVTRTQDD